MCLPPSPFKLKLKKNISLTTFFVEKWHKNSTNLEVKCRQMTLQIIFDYFIPRHKLENLSPNLTLSCPAIIYYLGVFFPPNSSSPTTLSFSLLPHPPPVSSIILIYCLFFTIDTMFLSFSLVSCFLLSLNSLLHCNTVFHFRQKKWKT